MGGDWQNSISNHSGITPHNGNYQDNYSFELLRSGDVSRENEMPMDISNIPNTSQPNVSIDATANDSVSMILYMIEVLTFQVALL